MAGMGNDHYIPRLILRRFTSDGKKTTPIVEYDLATATFTPRNIKNVCTMLDLNSLDDVVIARARAAGEDYDKETLERGIGRQIESPFADALQRIESAPEVLSSDDVDWLGSYVAFQFCRTPWAMGRHVAEAEGGITQREILALMLADQVRSFDLIKERQWSLWQARDDAGDFVLADSPVQLMTLAGQNLPLTPEALMDRDGVLTMPLTRRLMVRAQYDAPGGVTLPADAEMVARYNHISIAGAVHKLYMPHDRFTLWEGTRVGVVDSKHPRTYRFESSS